MVSGRHLIERKGVLDLMLRDGRDSFLFASISFSSISFLPVLEELQLAGAAPLHLSGMCGRFIRDQES